MIAKHLLGVALCSAFLLFHSQQGYSQIWAYDKLRQAPSPDVASLGSFINVPTANSAGLIPIDVPLTSLKTSTVDMPVSLSYNGSGIRVEQEATSVGMGWSFNCGGVITRSIRGTADDLWYGVQSTVIPDGKQYLGWLKSKISRRFAINFPDSFWTSTAYGGTLAVKQGRALAYIDPLTSSNVQDTEPDIFYVNAGPVKAKFIFDNNGKIRFLGRTDLKVEYAFAPMGGDCGQVVCGVDNFTIVDAAGNRYLFDQKEISKLETDEANFYTWQPPNVATVWYYYASAWFLSKVTSPDGHEIVYEYSDYTVKQIPRLSETRRSCVEGDCESHSGNTVGNRLSIDTKILSSARDSFTKLSFDISGRDDLEGAKKFDKMTIRSYETNKVLKELEFQYVVQTATRGVTGNAYFDKRLFLSKLREVNGSSVKAEYNFAYDRPEQLPSKRSTEQDFWGYFNGNGSTNLIPKLYVYPSLPAGDRYSLFPLVTYSGNEIALIGEERNTNPNLITVGSLKDIIFPTKGKVVYRFETHDFRDPQFGYRTGGGLRISEVRHLNEYDEEVLYTAYGYRDTVDNALSSGMLVTIPKFAKETTWGPNPNKHQGPRPAILAPDEGFTAYLFERSEFYPKPHWFAEEHLSEAELWNIFTERFSLSRTPLSDLDGQTVFYTNVQVMEGRTGKTVYSYYPPRTYKNSPTWVETAGWVDVINDPDSPPLCTGETIVYGKLPKSGYNIFPFPPMSMNTSFFYGKLKSVEVFDKFNHSTRKTSYEYTTLTKESSPMEVLCLTYGMQDALCWTGFRNHLLPHVFSIYRYYTDADDFVKRETSITNEVSGQITQYKEYTYGDHTQPVSIVEGSSDGSQRIQDFKYAKAYGVGEDWSGSSMIPALIDMVKNNIITPIEIVHSVKRNGETKVTGGQLITYRYFGSRLLPNEVWKLAIQTPILDFHRSYIDGLPNERVLEMDSRYYLTKQVDSYNSKSIPNQVTTEQNTYAYLYDYNDKYLVATVENAKVKDVFYTSFETASDRIALGKVGNYSKAGGFTKSLTGLTIGKYKLTYWRLNSGGWEFISQDVNVPGTTYTINITQTGNIDEIRFYPVGARMTTYVQDPEVGLRYLHDANNITTSYEYDEFQRLKYTKDDKGNIIRANTYHYKDQPQ